MKIGGLKANRGVEIVPGTIDDNSKGEENLEDRERISNKEKEIIDREKTEDKKGIANREEEGEREQ